MKAGSISFGRKHAAVAAGVFLSTILWAGLFANTGIIFNDFFTFKFHILLEKVLSVNFLLFLLAFPLTGAIITAFAKVTERTSLMISSLAAGLAALAIAMAVFAPLQEFWLLGVFYLISIPLRIETAYTQYAELKRYVSLRTFMSATGRGAAVIGIGLFVLSALTILPQQESYIDKFEETFFENVMQGLSTGKGAQQISEETADIYIKQQKQTLDALLSNQLFERLRGKTDPDVLAFVAGADMVRAQLDSDEYRQQVVSQLQQNTSQVGKEVDIIGLLKQRLPFIETLERFLWLIHGFTLASIFLFISSVLFKPAAAAYGLAIERILMLFGRQQTIK